MFGYAPRLAEHLVEYLLDRPLSEAAPEFWRAPAPEATVVWGAEDFDLAPLEEPSERGEECVTMCCMGSRVCASGLRL